MMQGKTMYADRPFVQKNGRRDFDESDYIKYDSAGKVFAYNLLKWIRDFQPSILKSFIGDYENIIFKIVETKTYGDIFMNADELLHMCEVDTRKGEHFKGNFFKTGNYINGIHIPQKPNIKKSNGIYLSLNGDDAIKFADQEIIPDSFIIIKTQEIYKHPLVPPQTKNRKVDPKNNDWKYLVPHNKAFKFGWDGEKYGRY